MRTPLKPVALAIIALTQPAVGFAQQSSVRVVPPAFPIPTLQSITVVKAGEPGPNSSEVKPVATISDYESALKLPTPGPYDVWWMPKDGLAIPIVTDVKIGKAEEEIKLAKHIGVVRLRGDGLPRAEFLALTPPDDPGPDEKGYSPVQIVSDYREEMVAPEGFYAIWMKPANGARAQRIQRKIRIFAGKVLDLD